MADYQLFIYSAIFFLEKIILIKNQDLVQSLAKHFRLKEVLKNQLLFSVMTESLNRVTW